MLMPQVGDVIRMCLDSNDQLLHMEVYQWLVSHHLYQDLIDIAKPSIELYLKKSTANPARRDAAEFADLLWKYHEKQGNHSAAAEILYTLAKTPGYEQWFLTNSGSRCGIVLKRSTGKHE